jgi:thioredoxin-dependent peroxiredoxin
MNKSNANITFKGGKITIIGNCLKEGDSLPSFQLTGNDLKDISNESFHGKKLVVSVVPSLDTPVCSLQTKHFNQDAAKLAPDCAILTVSMDLPFAQKRFCAAEGVSNVVTASDYKYRTFGFAYGVFIEELGLLSRAVFVADAAGKIRHVEYVQEVTSEPDYNAALKALSA